MSRSKKKTPVISWTIQGGEAGVQSKYRSKENRKLRRKVKVLVDTEQYETLPNCKEYGNEWSSPRDGKQWVDKDSKYVRK